MSFTQILSILRARWVTILAVTLSLVTLVVIASLIIPPRYTASSQLVIDSKSPDPINGTVMQSVQLPAYIATQIDVLQSERVARKVIQNLRLNESADMREQWRNATDGEGDFEAWLAVLLSKNLDVLPSRESSVINVEYTSADPRFAAALTNAYVRAYLDTTLELRVEPAKQFSSLFDEQIKVTRDKLEQAQNRLSAYQKEKGILATDERLDVENARLAELSSQVVGLQSLSAESGSRKAQAGANLAEVLNNPVVAGLKTDLSRSLVRHQELSSRLGAAHPQVIELNASIAELRERIDAETRRVTSSVGINNTVNQSREAQLRAALEAQRAKMLTLKGQRDEAMVLLRDVENAQRSYDALQARYAQSTLESQSNQTNVAILQAATPPSSPSFPLLFLNVIVAILMGGFLGVNTAIIREVLDRKLRSAEDVANLLGIPMMGNLPVATEAKQGILVPVTNSPRLTRRSLPELSAPRHV